MRTLSLIVAAVSLVSSPVFAQAANCRTDAANCQGFTSFGPAGVARCISIRGQTQIEFCQTLGETRRVHVHPGDQYCATAGSDPVPEQCTLHWITVTEPQ